MIEDLFIKHTSTETGIYRDTRVMNVQATRPILFIKPKLGQRKNDRSRHRTQKIPEVQLLSSSTPKGESQY